LQVTERAADRRGINEERGVSPLDQDRPCTATCILARMLRDLAEPVVAFDGDDRLVDLNPAAERLLGGTRDTLLGRLPSELFGAEADSVIQHHNGKRRDGEATVYEVQVPTPTGLRTWLISGSPMMGPDGVLEGSCGVIRDISERVERERRAEARGKLTLAIAASLRALVTSGQFDQAVRDALGAVGAHLMADGAVLYVADGRRYLPAFSWESEALLLEGPLARRLEPLRDDLPWLRQTLERKRLLLVRGSDDLPAEAVYERSFLAAARLTSSLALAVGSVERQGFLLFENPTRLDHHPDDCLPLLGMLADGVAASMKRQAAERERGLLITAVEQSDASIIITDSVGKILYVNPSFERITGYTRGETLGRNPRILKSGRHGKAFYQELWETLRAGMVWRGELINKRKDGSLLHESCIISPILDPGGRAFRYVAVKRDLTRERHLESQLRQSQTLEAVGRLAAGVAHEINSPTQYLGDNVAFFREAFEQLEPWVREARAAFGRAQEAPGDGYGDADRLQELAEAIDLDFLLSDIPTALAQCQDGVDRVARIVGALKEYSHPGSEGPTEADVNRLLTTSVTVARSTWKHVATVVEDLDPELPRILCHVAELNQALLNLVVNAAQAIAETGAGTDGVPMGVITLRSRRVEGAVRLEVEDSGPGIPTAVLPHIFEPFFTTKEVGKGTGQGLSVVRSVVVDLHHGRVGAQNRAGGGAVFHIELPLGPNPPHEPARS
jgi:PAS domain S-box-containing protein